MTKSHQLFLKEPYRVAIIMITNIPMITDHISLTTSVGFIFRYKHTDKQTLIIIYIYQHQPDTTSVGLPARSQASKSTHSTGVNRATVCSMTDTKNI